ncbi:hypothetical protein YPPY45_4476, partial [Yersinia pestis PY-45]
MWHGLGG